MQNKRAVVLWTGGKDCNLALHEARKAGYKIVALVTFAMGDARFRAHPLHFLKQQALVLNIAHEIIPVNEPYEKSYEEALASIKEKHNATTIVTGDIAEVHGQQNWITERSKPIGLNVFLPLWHADRKQVLEKLLALHFKVIFSCVKEPWFTSAWLGKEINQDAIQQLETLHTINQVDLCGEQGEYHTLVLDSPDYYASISIDSSSKKKEKEIMFLEIEDIFLHNKGGKKKYCPRCKTMFPCQTNNCWCNELPRIMTLPAEEDCLCPDCLKKEIENKIAATT